MVGSAGTTGRCWVTALAQVVYQGASDLHLTADAAPPVRVDGSLRPAVPGGPGARDKVIAARP
ncbi:hypothetical protein, partial [Curtobacterium sp. CT11-133]|uniref:hypothetical protein n=1 Tax=Curtobacterium sp. CT11-133 TaxID=3243014 RepID=UPI0039AFB84C